jgi:hypothetical protein
MTTMFMCAYAFAQVPTRTDSLSPIRIISPEDSARLVRASEFKTVRSDTLPATFTPTKSPGIALALSAVLPGAGQFYNESYWKIPIVLGFGYYFASTWIDNNDSTKHYRNLFAASITAENPNGTDILRQRREFYKDQRDTFSWYIFIYYIINLVDAYVDASLYDFDVGDDLGIQLNPSFQNVPTRQVSLKLKITF